MGSLNVIHVFDFPSCRQSQNLPELPLSAHLLAPIQRICRYPLHLSELVKHTAPTVTSSSSIETAAVPAAMRPDDSQESMEMALAAMKRVTELVNEGECSKLLVLFVNFQLTHRSTCINQQ